MTHDQVRDWLRAELGAQWSEALWAYLRDETGVEDQQWSAGDLPDLARSARRLLRIPRSGPASRGGPGVSGSDGERHRAASELLASEAARRPDVATFRQQIEGVIDWSGIDQWIEAQARADGPPTIYVEVPIPNGTRLRHRDGDVKIEPAFLAARASSATRQRRLAYMRPGDPWPVYRATSEHGVLERLRDLGMRLAGQFGWEEPQSTTWVLTDVPPAFASLTAAEHKSVGGPGAADRVILTIDPAVPAKDVAAFYRRVRGDNPQRAMTARHSRLATFAGATPGATWRKRMALWNKAYPAWEYTDERNFRRDAAIGKRRILRMRRGR